MLAPVGNDNADFIARTLCNRCWILPTNNYISMSCSKIYTSLITLFITVLIGIEIEKMLFENKFSNFEQFESTKSNISKRKKEWLFLIPIDRPHSKLIIHAPIRFVSFLYERYLFVEAKIYLPIYFHRKKFIASHPVCEGALKNTTVKIAKW